MGWRMSCDVGKATEVLENELCLVYPVTNILERDERESNDLDYPNSNSVETLINVNVIDI